MYICKILLYILLDRVCYERILLTIYKWYSSLHTYYNSDLHIYFYDFNVKIYYYI